MLFFSNPEGSALACVEPSRYEWFKSVKIEVFICHLIEFKMASQICTQYRELRNFSCTKLFCLRIHSVSSNQMIFKFGTVGKNLFLKKKSLSILKTILLRKPFWHKMSHTQSYAMYVSSHAFTTLRMKNIYYLLNFYKNKNFGKFLKRRSPYLLRTTKTRFCGFI